MFQYMTNVKLRTKAIRNTDKHNAAVMIASFTPFGYSGSSDNLSSAAASCIAVSSTVLSSPPLDRVPSATAGEDFSASKGGFSRSDVEVVVVEGSIVGAAVEGSVLARVFF